MGRGAPPNTGRKQGSDPRFLDPARYALLDDSDDILAPPGGWDDHDAWLAEEVLRRGGTPFDATRILLDWDAQRKRRSRSPEAESAFRLGDDLDLDLGDSIAALGGSRIPAIVAAAQMRYDTTIQSEWDSLPSVAKASFAYLENNKDTPMSRRAYYEFMRPAYYNAGFDDPAGTIFRKITSGALCGKGIAGGIHTELSARIPLAERHIEDQRKGMCAELGRTLKSLGGFVPRTIANTRVLSNHAYGLAVDVDPTWNPHFVSKKVIAALNEVASCCGFDFGGYFVDRGTMSDEEWVRRTHAKAQEASDIVQAWLQKHLRNYKLFVAERKRQQDAAKQQEKAKRDLEAAKKNKKTQVIEFTEPAVITMPAPKNVKPPASAPTDAASVRAYELLDILAEGHGFKTLDAWEKDGIQTIPLELAVALTRVGCRWGQCYKSSKDGMHFELLAEQIFPGRSPRTLDELRPAPDATIPGGR